jgi:hypothetical protein
MPVNSRHFFLILSMKRIIVTLFLTCLIFSLCFAQSEFKFSEVVKADSVKSETLASKAKAWLIAKKFSEIDTSATSTLKGNSWYKVYQKGAVSKQIHGTITYNLVLEIKDNKYRYTFDDFVFHYHKPGRNQVMVPTGKTKPLTDEKAEGWQKTWEKHKSYTKQQIKILIADLKDSMVTPTKSETKKEDF